MRETVLIVLEKLYTSGETVSAGMETFATRFLARFLELCQDVDDKVVYNAIRVIIAMDKLGFVEGEAGYQSDRSLRVL